MKRHKFRVTLEKRKWPLPIGKLLLGEESRQDSQKFFQVRHIPSIHEVETVFSLPSCGQKQAMLGYLKISRR